MLELLQRLESLYVHDPARKQSSILPKILLILTENKIPITVEYQYIYRYIFSPIAFIKTYQSQYRSKESIRFTQCL